METNGLAARNYPGSTIISSGEVNVELASCWPVDLVSPLQRLRERGQMPPDSLIDQPGRSALILVFFFAHAHGHNRSLACRGRSDGVYDHTDLTQRFIRLVIHNLHCKL